MAELLALLLSTLSGLLGSGKDAKELSLAIERAVEARPPAVIEELDVECRGVSGRTVEEITLKLAGLELTPLLIESATIKVSVVRLQSDGRLSLGKVSWRAKIAEGALTDALRTQVDSLSDASISIDSEALSLSGTYPLLAVKLPYSVAGELGVENETQLVFRILQSGAAGVAVPAGLNRLIEREINPVYDLARFAARNEEELAAASSSFNYDFALSIDAISNAKGHIIVNGEA